MARCLLRATSWVRYLATRGGQGKETVLGLTGRLLSAYRPDSDGAAYHGRAALPTTK
jgi:hypothetical protein